MDREKGSGILQSPFVSADYAVSGGANVLSRFFPPTLEGRVLDLTLFLV